MTTSYLTAAQITGADLLAEMQENVDPFNAAIANDTAAHDHGFVDFHYSLVADICTIVQSTISNLGTGVAFTSPLSALPHVEVVQLADSECFPLVDEGMRAVLGLSPSTQIMCEIDSVQELLERGGWGIGQTVTAQHILDGVAGLLADAASRLFDRFAVLVDTPDHSTAYYFIGGPDAVREEGEHMSSLTDSEVETLQEMSDSELEKAVREASESVLGDRFEDEIIEKQSSTLLDLRQMAVRIALGKE